MVKYNNISEAFNALVPDCGMAETKRGEVVRAYMRLNYRWYNDGDMPGDDYGNETCNSSARYLHAELPFKYRDKMPIRISRNIPYYTGNPDEEGFWEAFEDVILAYINDEDEAERLDGKNFDDSRGENWIFSEDYDYLNEDHEVWE